jgi:hypothetical protein
LPRFRLSAHVTQLFEVERREMTVSTDAKRSPAAKGDGRSARPRHRGRSPYPEKAAFIDADEPQAGHAIERATDQGLAVVLVSSDGSTRVLRPDLAAH